MNTPKLTSYQDLLKRTKTAIVTTRLNNTYEIKVLQPGDFVAVIGTPITRRLFVDPKGKFVTPDMKDEAEALQTLEQLMSDEEFVTNAKNIVCRGVISLNFVNKPQDKCDLDKEELSVDLLDFNDVMDLLSFLMVVSSDDREVKDYYTFRDVIGGEQADSDSDTPTSERV